jgi:DNA polymerase III subunit gamma/tau
MATQSLYRRYRPRRFSELKGQDHVVKALRDAVMSGREGQAYLFSGPRGTGKTTSARILAKVLNCENVIDGEPCCECESCLAVERGTSYDVHELDAASNRGIEAMRNLIERTALGTSGRHKVYILDEVHMLTKEASGALLKTLEEPPPHVVFVLATTDPQKVLDTIKSRTQHLQFHLLPTDTLAAHVRWVADDAGLDLPQAALDAALVRGGGSARDTLSALELLVSTGGEADDIVDLDEFLRALIDRDPGRILTAMAHAVSLGHDVRAITEDVVRHLRNAFLSLMAPELVVLPSERLDAVAAEAQELGAAGLVRAIELLGSTLVEMRHAPDPRIMVEVALVQLTSDEAGGDVDVLAARLERLEHLVKDLRESGVASAAAEAPRDPATGRAVVGGAAKHAAAQPPVAQAAAQPVVPQPAVPAAQAASDVAGDAEGRAVAGDRVTRGSTTVPDAWNNTVKGQLKGMARPLFAAGEFVGEVDGVWQFSVPNPTHREKCNACKADVEQALSAAVGVPVRIEVVVEGSGDIHRPVAALIDEGTSSAAEPAPPDESPQPATPPPPRVSAVERATRAAAAAPEPEPHVRASADLPDDDEIDLSELSDAPPESVQSPIDRLAEAFPGSELVADD